MEPQQNLTRAQLMYWLEQNDMELLFSNLKSWLQDNERSAIFNDLILLSSRFEKYQRDNTLQLQNGDQLKIEYNQIKYALQTLIAELDLPQGELSLFQKKEKNVRQIFKQILGSEWRWSVLVTLLSLAVLVLGQKKISWVDFSLEARVSQLGLRVMQEWKIGQGQDLILDQFGVDVVQQASFTSETASTTGAPFSFEVSGFTRLDQLFVPTKEALTMLCDGNETLVRVVNGPIQGSLQVQKGVIHSPELALEQQIGVEDGSEQLDFTSDLNPTFYLNISPKKNYTLPPVRIDSIGFNRLSFDQDSSTIKAGLLEIAGTKTALKLGDRLKLKLQQGELKLSIKDGEINLSLRGKIQEAKLGQLDESRNLMPNWLLYVQQNQIITFYTVAFAAIFGFFYPLRKLFFTHKN